MASGHVNRIRLTGRTHGCTDQACDVKISLANPEPSTHGTKQTCRLHCAMSALRGQSGKQMLLLSFSGFDPSETSANISCCSSESGCNPYQSACSTGYDAVSRTFGGGHETAQVHDATRRCGCVADGCAGAADVENAAHRLFHGSIWSGTF